MVSICLYNYKPSGILRILWLIIIWNWKNCKLKTNLYSLICSYEIVNPVKWCENKTTHHTMFEYSSNRVDLSKETRKKTEEYATLPTFEYFG